MTLDEAANYVCKKVRRQDATSIVRCKEYLQQRAEMVWNDQLWKESLAETFIAYSPDTLNTSSFYHSTDGILRLPIGCEKVIAIRESAWDYAGAPQANVLGGLVPVQWEDAFADEFEWLGKEGTARKFIILPPCVYAFQPNNNAANGSGSSIGVSLDMTNHFTDAEASVSMVYVDAYGNHKTYSGRYQSSPFFGGGTGMLACQVNDFAKGSSLQAWTLRFYIFGTGYDTVRAITFTTDAGQAPKQSRIKLINRPDRDSYYRILCKREFPGWLELVDAPMQSSVNALLAFAQGDMLQHMFQYGMAKECFSEGEALLEQLKRVETVQQAHRQRIIPSDGIGAPDYYSGFISKS